MATARRTYWAIDHTYGAGMGDENGHFIGTLAAFSSPRLRREWVANGQPYITNPHYRAALSASRPEIRLALRNADATGWRPWIGGDLPA